MITKLDRATTVMEPLPDPPEKRDMQQNRHCVASGSALGAFFGGRGDVLVAGDGYLIVSTGSVEDWAEHFYPDCVVAFGVDPESIIDRNGYVISEVGKPPDFVMEIASKTTSSRDETVKLEGYANMIVPEYWMFDGSGKGYYSRGSVWVSAGWRRLPTNRVDCGSRRRGARVQSGAVAVPVR